MKISEFGISLIEEFEGFRPTVYLDSGGIKTIGYGHALKQGEDFKSLTMEEGRKLLLNDIRTAESFIPTSIKNKMIFPEEYDALVSFVFNIGGGAFQKSNVYKFLKQRQQKLALQWWAKWIRDSKGEVLKGLVKRRKKEINLFNMNNGYLSSKEKDSLFIF